MDLLAEILARAAQPQDMRAFPIGTNDQYETQPGAIPGSLLDDFTKKKKAKFAVMPPAQEGLPDWANRAGIVAPGLGGLGNLDAATTRAPMSPLDPNYAPEDNFAFSRDPSGGLQTFRAGDRQPGIPVPSSRPREADGSIAPPPAQPPSTDLSSQQRGPAAEDDNSAAPVAAPRAPGAPSAQAPQPGGAPQLAAPSLWDQAGAFGNNAMNFLRNNSSTLLALGAGFAGAPNIGQGISRAAQYAIPATQQDLKNRMLLQNQSQTYQALIEAGVPPQQALASIGNPELQKRLLDSYITDRKYDIKTVKSKNAWGEETERLVAVNPYDPAKSIDMGQAPGAGGTTAVGPGGNVIATSGGKSAFYAPGVTDANYDPTKIGDDYLNQFSPEVQQAAKDYLAGRTSQTGRQIPQQRIKMIAQKYGSDMGMPADDAAISQRRQWSNSLGNTSSGVGLQAKGFQQGLEHFAGLSDALVKMKLSNGGGWETGANFINWLKSQSTDQQELIHNADVKGQALAREMGNLFAKNGGGVHEAAETKKNVSNAMMSSKAAAGSLEAIVELMHGGLSALEQRRDELFPNEADRPRGSNFLGPKQQAALDKIERNIAILRGDAPAPAASSARVAAPPPGRYAYDPATGTMKPLQ